jgi:hypothetical protein
MQCKFHILVTLTDELNIINNTYVRICVNQRAEILKYQLYFDNKSSGVY